MKTVKFTEFRKRASDMLSDVEQGETLVILRHGRPIAEISPIARGDDGTPSWKRPALRLVTRGDGLSAAIREERARESLL